MRRLPINLRPRLALLAAACFAAVALYGWIDLTSRSPAALPIDLGPGAERAVTFRVYGGGLYETVLQVNRTAPRSELICKLGAPIDEAPNGECRIPPVALSWSIYRNGVLIARDEKGPARAVDGVVRDNGARAEREMGSVRLRPGLEYSLVVRSTTDARPLGLSHPVMLVRLHPWEFPNYEPLLLLLVGLSFVAVLALLWLLGDPLLAAGRYLRKSRLR